MPPTKSPNDYRSYRVVKLSNGITALLISDVDPKKETSSDETKRAAAALAIATGGFDDPDDVPGLAHFLEHMVFMGSEKFPDENGFDSFLQSHGGSTNATTSAELTVFEFEIHPGHYAEGLDRFVQFFISPLLCEDTVQRETKAVDSEFKEKVQDDDERCYQVLVTHARKDHPMSKFYLGNKVSLMRNTKKKGINIMQKLQTFFQELYCTRPMTVSLCSTETLDKLEDMARKYFSGIKSRPEVVPDHLKTVLDNPYDDLKSFHKLYYVTAVEERHCLSLSWVLPAPQAQFYRSKPAYYVSFLLGHECTGSVYSVLKKKGFIESLSAYKMDWSMLSTFHCDVELTDLGFENVAEIVHTIFQYITLLQKTGACKSVYDEITQIDQILFKYLEPSSPIDYVVQLVEAMNFYAESDWITGPCLIPEYDPQLIETVQSYLTTEDVNIFLLSKTFGRICNKVEPWYKAKYTVKDIPKEWLDPSNCSSTNDDLHLPKRNRFIAEDLNLKKEFKVIDTQYPQVIHETHYGKVWYRYDYKYQLPKAYMFLMMVSPYELKSSMQLVCKELFDRVFNFKNFDLSYEAVKALLWFNCYSSALSRELSVDGFTDKLFLMFKEVVDTMKNFDFTSIAFDVCKEMLKKDYRNTVLSATGFCSELDSMILYRKTSNVFSNLKVLNQITEKHLENFAKEYFSELNVQCLVQGNLTEEDARSFLDHFYSVFNYKPVPIEDFPRSHILKLPIGRTVCRHNSFNRNDPNTSVQNYYQIGPCNLRLYTTAYLLSHVMSEPLFDILRTQEQLGYSVGQSANEYYGILSFNINVETDVTKCTPDYVDSKIKEFLLKFDEKLSNFTADEYQKYVTSYVNLLKEADITLYDEASRNWAEIESEEYLFDRCKQMIAYTEEISKEELLDLLRNHLINKETIRVLSIQVVGHSTDDESQTTTTDSEGSKESNSDTDSQSLSSDDGSSSDEDDDELDDRKIDLIFVDSEQYTQCIANIEEYQLQNSFYPYMTVTGAVV